MYDHVIWPEQYDPRHSAIYALNDIDVKAPLRLVAPVKLGLKNIKAITRITYTGDEPPDYWAKRGYSRYDGI